MKVRGVAEATVARLPTYVDCLARLAEQGVKVVSSAALSRAAGVGAAQLRKDLSYLGDFGVRGRGYEVEELRRQIAACLGLHRQWAVLIVGYGKLGSALANYRGFARKNFRVVAAVDIDLDKVGPHAGGLQVHAVEELGLVVRDEGVNMAIIATPAPVAQWVADRLVEAGVRAILNFAPVALSVPADVSVREVDLATEMQILSFYETQRATSPAQSPSATQRGRRRHSEEQALA